MSKIVEVVNAVAAESSTNGKVDILKNAFSDKSVAGTLACVCKQAYDTALTYGIIPDDSFDIVAGEFPQNGITLEYAIDRLPELEDRSYTGNAAKDLVEDLARNLDPDEADLYLKILRRDLRFGASVTLINKAYKAVFDKPLIETFKVALASPMKDIKKEDIKFPVYVEPKCDGVRAVYSYSRNKFLTRNGKHIDVGDALLNEAFTLCDLWRYENEDLEEMVAENDLYLDGEILVYDCDNPLPRKTGNGIINKAIKGTVSPEEQSKFVFSIWDAVPIGAKVHLAGRKIRMAESLNNPENPYRLNRIRMIEDHIVNSWDEVEDLYETYRAQGEEGIIIKKMNSQWEPKRTKNWIKMKAEETAELRVIGTQYGTGKYAGMVGALLCEDESGTVRVDVGSGFNDEQRKEHYPIGTIIEVKYNEPITKLDGSRSLFLPIFIRTRPDKDDATDLSKEFE